MVRVSNFIVGLFSQTHIALVRCFCNRLSGTCQSHITRWQVQEGESSTSKTFALTFVCTGILRMRRLKGTSVATRLKHRERRISIDPTDAVLYVQRNTKAAILPWRFCPISWAFVSANGFSRDKSSRAN